MRLPRRICLTAFALALAVTGLALRVGAADEKPANNPTGTWKVTFPNQTNSPALRLELQGDKLTGTMSRQAGYKIEELALENGKLKRDEISFATRHFASVYVKNILQPTDTNQVTLSTYRGKISGDAIKGKVERDTRGTFANVARSIGKRNGSPNSDAQNGAWRARPAQPSSQGAKIERRGQGRQSRNQREEGLTAEYAKYAEDRIPPGSPSVDPCIAVRLVPEESSPPAKNPDYCKGSQRVAESSISPRSTFPAHKTTPSSTKAFACLTATSNSPDRRWRWKAGDLGGD